MKKEHISQMGCLGASCPSADHSNSLQQRQHTSANPPVGITGTPEIPTILCTLWFLMTHLCAQRQTALCNKRSCYEHMILLSTEIICRQFKRIRTCWVISEEGSRTDNIPEDSAPHSRRQHNPTATLAGVSAAAEWMWKRPHRHATHPCQQSILREFA